MARKKDDDPVEIVIAGDIGERSADLHEKLIEVPHGGECVLYFDSPGGNPYSALSLMSLMVLRDLKATGIVTGECSSAALWPFAACRRRIVTPFSALLFHPMRWQSEENVQLPEAAEWARHFAYLEGAMDELLAESFGMSLSKLQGWMRPGRYLSGPEMVEAGLAEMEPLFKSPKKSSAAKK